MARTIPSRGTVKRKCQDLGCWGDFTELRSRYRMQGLLASEANERAFVELEVAERWAKWRNRKTQSQILGSNVPLTEDERREILPSCAVPSVTQGAEVGDQVLSMGEEVLWARDQRAMVQNGSDPPKFFPSKGALSWYQYAVSSPMKFQDCVMKIQSPTGGSDDVWMRDGEYQFSQIESQVAEAVKEVGEQLGRFESGFADTLNAALSVGSEGSVEQPVVPA